MKIQTISLKETDFVDPDIWKYVLDKFNIEKHDTTNEEDSKTTEFQTAFVLVDSLLIYDDEFIEKTERETHEI